MRGSMQMTHERWTATEAYLRDVFGVEDTGLRAIRDRAAERGLPDIAITPEVGRFLHLLAGSCRADRAIEVGTLAGYSAAWIARALPAQGRLYTIERDPAYASFAEEQLASIGLSDRVEVKRGAALEVLDQLASALAPASVGFAFIDAEKTEYLDYFRKLSPLIAPGGMIVADNVLGTSRWWIDQLDHPERSAIDRFLREVVRDPDFECAGVPMREGLLIARCVRERGR
jgi:caffeoyl-CoA O-methyltransferase